MTAQARSGPTTTVAAPPPARAISTGAGWRAVAILLLLYLLSMLDRNVLTLLVGPIKARLGIGDVQVSLLIGFAFALLYAVAGLPLGWALDRFPRRLVIFGCVLVWSLGTAACGMAGSFLWLFLARAAVGGGESAIMPAAQSILADAFPPEKLALPLSIVSLGAKGGQALALIIGGALTSLVPPSAPQPLPLIGGVVEGWQAIFLLLGLPGLVFALLAFAIPEPPRPKAARARGGYGEYLAFFRRHAGLLTFSHLGAVTFLTASLAMVSWAPAYFQRGFGWSAARTGATLGTVLLVAAVVGTPLHGLLADRIFRRGMLDAHLRYMAGAALMGLPFGLGACFARDPHLAVALIGIFFFVISCYVSLPMVLLQILAPPALRGRAGAVLLLVAGLGGTTLGPLLVSLFTDRLFHDATRVGSAIALALALSLPLTALFNSLAMAPARRALGPGRSLPTE